MTDPKCTYPDCFSCQHPDCVKEEIDIIRAKRAKWKRNTIAKKPEYYRQKAQEYRDRVRSRDPEHFARLQKEYRERKAQEPKQAAKQ